MLEPQNMPQAQTRAELRLETVRQSQAWFDHRLETSIRRLELSCAPSLL
jgi:hypothetical protein